MWHTILVGLGIAIVASLVIVLEEKYVQKKSVSSMEIVKKSSIVFLASVVILTLKNTFLGCEVDTTASTVDDIVELPEAIETGEPGF